MIVTTTAYGVLLTGEFGRFFNIFSDFSKLVQKEEMEQYFSSCPSAEDYQYVLGMDVSINKNMNIELIHKEWLEHMESLPKPIKSLIKKIEKINPKAFEPDFQILAGKC